MKFIGGTYGYYPLGYYGNYPVGYYGYYPVVPDGYYGYYPVVSDDYYGYSVVAYCYPVVLLSVVDYVVVYCCCWGCCGYVYQLRPPVPNIAAKGFGGNYYQPVYPVYPVAY